MDTFLKSKENQEKYGFTYVETEEGIGNIHYDGDFDELMRIAREACGYTIVKMDGAPEDLGDPFSLVINEEGDVIRKETDEKIIFDVDGEGERPNFYFQFTDEGFEFRVRFSLTEPKFYDSEYAYQYFLPLSSLTVINKVFRANYLEFVSKWNALRPDCMVEHQSMLPNYRAIYNTYFEDL